MHGVFVFRVTERKTMTYLCVCEAHVLIVLWSSDDDGQAVTAEPPTGGGTARVSFTSSVASSWSKFRIEKANPLGGCW